MKETRPCATKKKQFQILYNTFPQCLCCTNMKQAQDLPISLPTETNVHKSNHRSFPSPAYSTLSTPLKDIAGPHESLYLAVHNKSYSSLSKTQ